MNDRPSIVAQRKALDLRFRPGRCTPETSRNAEDKSQDGSLSDAFCRGLLTELGRIKRCQNFADVFLLTSSGDLNKFGRKHDPSDSLKKFAVIAILLRSTEPIRSAQG